MTVLVTGSTGFVGRNVVLTLHEQGHTVLEFNRNSTREDLNRFVKTCDAVIHLMGVARPENKDDFYTINHEFVSELCYLLRKSNNQAPVVFSSSIHATNNNDYGISKKMAEEELIKHAELNQSTVYIYRFPHLFGKWARPNQHSVVATWCYNISRDIPIEIHDPSVELNMHYIDDVVAELIRAIEGKANFTDDYYCSVTPTHTASLKRISELLFSFRDGRKNMEIPDLGDQLTKKLYCTYLSYLDASDLSCGVESYAAEGYRTTEYLKSALSGKISIQVIKPGEKKADQLCHSKHKKILVILGEGSIQTKDLLHDKEVEYRIESDMPEVIDIPVGFSFTFINSGQSELIVLVWDSEL